jgi:hypothetical protein
MTDDPILDEIQQIREQLLASFGGDLKAMTLDAQRRTEEAAASGRRVVISPRPPTEPAPVRKIG